ncbi:class E sortase [Nocardioides pacificus]
MSKPPRTRGARWALLVGVALIVAGLGALGYVGWQMYGTNWVSERKHADIVETLEQDWDAGERFAEVGDGKATAIIRIPRFGRKWAVPVLEGTSDKVLAAGIGHFEGTASAGAVGNYALAGHRVTHGEPFADMPRLRAGDKVIVETREAVFTYELDSGGEDLNVPFTETWVVDPLPRNPDEGEVQPRQRKGQRLITLTTCAELFHTDDRLIAFGHLVDEQRR